DKNITKHKNITLKDITNNQTIRNGYGMTGSKPQTSQRFLNVQIARIPLDIRRKTEKPYSLAQEIAELMNTTFPIPILKQTTSPTL
ncbi:hypothetical protein LC607_35630, partial [Nostoc sp. CHAB 5824]|nr:hypothetical protein [Nostoc sp. CHAB 5824]